MLTSLKDGDARFRVLQRIATLEEHNAKASLDVVNAARERNDVEMYDRFSRQLMEIAPFDIEHRFARIEAVLARGDAKVAQTMMDRLPPKVLAARVDAQLLRARILIALGQKSAAKSILESMKPAPSVQTLLDSLR